MNDYICDKFKWGVGCVMYLYFSSQERNDNGSSQGLSEFWKVEAVNVEMFEQRSI